MLAVSGGGRAPLVLTFDLYTPPPLRPFNLVQSVWNIGLCCTNGTVRMGALEVQDDASVMVLFLLHGTRGLQGVLHREFNLQANTVFSFHLSYLGSRKEVGHEHCDQQGLKLTSKAHAPFSSWIFGVYRGLWRLVVELSHGERSGDEARWFGFLRSKQRLPLGKTLSYLSPYMAYAYRDHAANCFTITFSGNACAILRVGEDV